MSKGKKDNQISFRVDDEIYARLKSIIKAEKVTITEFFTSKIKPSGDSDLSFLHEKIDFIMRTSFTNMSVTNTFFYVLMAKTLMEIYNKGDSVRASLEKKILNNAGAAKEIDVGYMVKILSDPDKYIGELLSKFEQSFHDIAP